MNSGSNGNCYYVGNGEEAILVDAGITCAEIEKRMGRLGLSLEKVKALFVSHEHSDHILGVPGLARKYRLSVYITNGTYAESRFHIRKQHVHAFRPLTPVHVGQLAVTAFSKHHDAIDPHSFVICCGGITVGVFTDIGHPCDQVITHFSKCHAAFLETNYDEDRLSKGKYPAFLKSRIRSDKGHLSNIQALELFTKHRPPFMSHLLLSHLSKENNAPEIVDALFSAFAGPTKIILASREKETPVYRIEHIEFPKAEIPSPFVKKAKGQLSLF
ncbi:MAG: MBL fold metallo-hydrolase [Chitinophagales bacterium]